MTTTATTSTYLEPTELLDFETDTIQRLIEERGWRMLDTTFERIGAAYRFVRDEIQFGYNEKDGLSASRVLADGYGQCNTKATLLVALLRALGVPTRLHGATIHKELQKGVVNGVFYWIAPTNINHTWAEVKLDDSGGQQWVGLEGVILDAEYLRGLRALLPRETGSFLGFGAGTKNLMTPPVEWRGGDTFIQAEGVNQDFGVFNDPDSFYAKHGENVTGVKGALYATMIRHVLNANVADIRARAAAMAEATAGAATSTSAAASSSPPCSVSYAKR